MVYNIFGLLPASALMCLLKARTHMIQLVLAYAG